MPEIVAAIARLTAPGPSGGGDAQRPENGKDDRHGDESDPEKPVQQRECRGGADHRRSVYPSHPPSGCQGAAGKIIEQVSAMRPTWRWSVPQHPPITFNSGSAFLRRA
jgi:hypothetical protein